MNNKIVISKTPLRVSFVGGGTDMPYFLINIKVQQLAAQ